MISDTNVPNIFFKLKKVQLKSLKDKISLVMHKCKLNGQKISVRDVLDDATREKIVRLNEGYYIFKDIRNTPAYLSKKKKEVFAILIHFNSLDPPKFPNFWHL